MQGTVRVNPAGAMLETLLDCDSHEASNHESASHHTSSDDTGLTAIIRKEIAKYMTNKGKFAQARFAQTSFAGIPSKPILSCNLNALDFPSRKGSWIIDTRASNHICNNLNQLVDITNIQPPLPVFLPVQKHFSHQCSIPSNFPN